MLGLIYWAFVEPKIRTTIVTVFIAVAASAGIWVGANFLFDLVRQRWLTFNVIVFGIVGALVGIALHGNRITLGSGTGFLTWVVGPLVGAATFGASGSRARPDRRPRPTSGDRPRWQRGDRTRDRARDP